MNWDIGNKVVFRKPEGLDPTGCGTVCGQEPAKLRILVEWDDGIIRKHRMSLFVSDDIVCLDSYAYKNDFMEKIKDRLNG